MTNILSIESHIRITNVARIVKYNFREIDVSVITAPACNGSDASGFDTNLSQNIPGALNGSFLRLALTEISHDCALWINQSLTY